MLFHLTCTLDCFCSSLNSVMSLKFGAKDDFGDTKFNVTDLFTIGKPVAFIFMFAFFSLALLLVLLEQPARRVDKPIDKTSEFLTHDFFMPISPFMIIVFFI